MNTEQPAGVLDISWRPSRYTHLANEDSGALLLYNTLRTTIARVPADQSPSVAKALADGFRGIPRDIYAELVLGGFFVPQGTNESAIADEQFAEDAHKSDSLQLILLASENCNFRCTYCAQPFARNKMERPVIEGIVQYFREQASRLSSLTIGWFGGEPLTAPDVIEEVATRLQGICREHAIDYKSGITTNGYLLRPNIARMLFRAEVRQYQITLDGLPEDHDRLRVLADRRTGTAQRILENLRGMRESDEDFLVQLRVNFDRNSLGRIESFLDRLKREFSADNRFFFDFHPVGKWGGPNDERLQTCGIEDGERFSFTFAKAAAERGFEPKAVYKRLLRFGARCYAANPSSFVIGANGTVYKCTVAFEDERNHVGHMTPEGKLLLDTEKHNRWLEPGSSTSAQCRGCGFRPACHGNACPLARMNSGGRSACPSIKHQLPQAIRVVASNLVTHIQSAEKQGKLALLNG